MKTYNINGLVEFILTLTGEEYCIGDLIISHPEISCNIYFTERNLSTKTKLKKGSVYTYKIEDETNIIDEGKLEIKEIIFSGNSNELIQYYFKGESK